MFCPKCGSQNADETKFCRGCGAELGNVLAALEGGKPEGSKTLAEKYVSLYSRGIRGMLLGAGFLVISAVVYSRPPQDGIFWLLPLMFAFMMIATGVSRFVQAFGIKKLSVGEQPALLPAAQKEFLKPASSIYETDDLEPRFGLNGRTTKHLKVERKD